MTNSMFVILSSQRTGSNLLVSKLNTIESITCHGELYNPAFVGVDPSYYELTGYCWESTQKRDQDRGLFINTLREKNQKKILGFKFFPGHGAQTHRSILEDVQIKKVFLRRNVVQSFVSREIALKSGVWMINRTKDKKLLKKLQDKVSIKIEFDPYEFEQFYKELTSFWIKNINILNNTSQPFFEIWYSQLNNNDVFRQLLNFIGCKNDNRLTISTGTTLKQSAAGLREKVSNYEFLQEYMHEKELSHLLQ